MNLTTNATHYYPEAFRPGRLALLDISGTFGGATVTPGYKAADGAFSPYLQPDGSSTIAITARGGFQVRVPREGQIGVTITGATGTTAIVFDVIPAVDMPPGS